MLFALGYWGTRLKEDEGGVPSAVAESHRKELESMGEIVRKEQKARRNLHIPVGIAGYSLLISIFFFTGRDRVLHTLFDIYLRT